MPERTAAPALRYLESGRLRLIAATAPLVAEDLGGRRALAAALGTRVPDNWPPELYDRTAMEFTARQLRDGSQQGWSFWYLVFRAEEVLVGICGFKGRPDRAGSVEIGYSILQQFRGRGFATEAVARLVEWAFGHPAVQQVCAETFPHLVASIRVLKKNGFHLTGPGSEHGVVRYARDRVAMN